MAYHLEASPETGARWPQGRSTKPILEERSPRVLPIVPERAGPSVGQRRRPRALRRRRPGSSRRGASSGYRLGKPPRTPTPKRPTRMARRAKPRPRPRPPAAPKRRRRAPAMTNSPVRIMVALKIVAEGSTMMLSGGIEAPRSLIFNEYPAACCGVPRRQFDCQNTRWTLGN